MSTSPFVPVADSRSRSCAHACWQEILRGEWRIVKVFETDRVNFMARRECAADQTLSDRERDVARFTALGYSGKWISYELDLSASTISTYLTQALDKLGLESATELALLCPLFADDNTLSGDIELRTYHVGAHEFAVISLPPLDLDLFDELSGAERDVVTLVVDGWTNRAIAEERGVSSRTVANQLASVYRKLDVNSRTELAVRISLR